MVLYKLKNSYELKEKNTFIKVYSYLFGKEAIKVNKFYKKFLNFINYILRLIFIALFFKKKKTNFLKAILMEKSSENLFTIRDNNSQFHSIYFPKYSNGYEPEINFVINKLISSKGTFIDIGSNWGHHAFAASYKSKKVVCFEPNPDVFSDLLRIRKELNLEKKVDFHQVALSDKNQDSLELTQIGFETGIASLSQNFNSRRINSLTFKILQKLTRMKPIRFKVSVKNIDSYGFENIDLIKLDAEGFEYEILQGSSKTLEKNNPYLIFEHHATNIDNFEKYFNFFIKKNYILYKIEYILINRNDSVYDFQFTKIEASYDLKLNQIYNLLAVPNHKLDIFNNLILKV